MDSKTVRCPACATAIVLLLPPSRGIEHAAHTHQCQDKDGAKASSVFKISRHPNGGTTTLTVITEFKA